MRLLPRPDPKSQLKTADGISAIATKLRAGPPGVRILAVVKENFLLQNVQTGSGTKSAFYLMGAGVRPSGKPTVM
jgi:hypothetical protein